MNGSETLETTDEVTRLVRTVERLAVADQERILRIVSLLAMAPSPVQHRTQRMLKELLDSAPVTMRECVSGVEEVIEYLEDSLLRSAEGPGRAAGTFSPPWSGRHN
jgi:hypothetical protein